jgi:hypothetical protein
MRSTSRAAVLAGLAGFLMAVSPVLAQGGGRGGGGGGGGGGGRGGDRQGAGQPGQPGQDGGGRRFGGGMGGMGMGGGPMAAFNNPTMNSRELTKYADLLGLDADQREAAKALLDGYQQQFNAGRQEMQDRMQAAREEARGGGGGGAGFAAFREIGQKWQTQREKMDREFLSDFKGILTPEQEKNWPRFERVHRRDHSMDRGLISGERLDVFRLVEDAKLSPDEQAKVSPILARYEEDLDRELVNRDQVQRDVFSRQGEVMQSGDQDAAQRLIQQGRDAAVRVRDVNRKYAREVQEQLPESKQFEFAKAVKQASFPNVYNDTYGQRALTAAVGFGDLTPDQKESVRAIRDAYNRDLAVVNDKIAAAQEKMEMSFNVGQMMGGGGRDQGELGELRRDKRDLEEATLENLRKVLNEDQRARLPRQQDRGDFGPGQGGQRMRGGGDGAGGGDGQGGRRRGGRSDPQT